MNHYFSWNLIPRVTPDKYLRLSQPYLPKMHEAPLPWIAHGNGRSYSDVCLNDEGSLLLTRDMDRFIDFDASNGILRCESGITLYEILNLIVPKGWFLPCTPGTAFATLGGALANDVHGKNHHNAGSFGNHVRAFGLTRSNGEELVCSVESHSNLFHATVGGLGLTGIITWIEIQLQPISNPWLWTVSQRFENLDEFWLLNAKAEHRWPYTVAWIDCLARGKTKGRGILFCGQHAAPQSLLPAYRKRNLKLSLTPPVSLINQLSLRTFNAIYFRQKVNPEGKLSHFIPYFYPLDYLEHWNRIYGRRGFYQYQCVIPPKNAQDGIKLLLDRISKKGQGSFLAVLKTFGNQTPLGILSFSRPGTTLALDFPNNDKLTLSLLADLDAIVLETGGALYPAKDARMPATMFRASYPDWEKFGKFIDPAFSSLFWKRVTS